MRLWNGLLKTAVETLLMERVGCLWGLVVINM